MNNLKDETIKTLLSGYLVDLNITLTGEQLQKLEALLDHMLLDPFYPSVSKIFAKEEIAQKHFLDSLAPLSFAFTDWRSSKFIDLGTGGGFPCLPLAIALPDCTFLAVDSRRKSVEFVARMADSIGLRNVSVMHSRIEEVGRNPDCREKYDVVVCRALSAVRTLVEYTLPIARTGGSVFFYKGPRLTEEMNESANAFKQFSIGRESISEYSLLPPLLPFERNYVRIEKNSSVPARFPRKSGLPASKPL